MRVTTNNIVELFLAAAAKHPENIAIIEGDKKISYAALEKEVKATAAYFKQKNIGPGDRVLVFLPMGIDLYRVVLALFYIGATAVFLDEWVSKKRMEVCCQLADCKGFIGVFKARVFAFFSKELRRIPITLSLRKRSNKSLSVANVFDDSAALITFTTGSTGIPKAARRSHGFLQNQFDALLEEIQPQVSDVDMPVLPIVLFVNLGIGCTSVIADFRMTKPESMRPQQIAAQIKQHQVNRITASPFFIDKLATYAVDHQKPFVGIEKIFTGGAPVFPQKAAAYSIAFPNAKSTIVYGSTEAEPISSIDAIELSEKENLPEQGLPVGRIFHQTYLKIIRITKEPIQPTNGEAIWQDIQLADEEVGEIIVAGPHVLKQYFRNETAFQQNKIVIGDQVWHRTGDSGFIKNQTLFLTGRCQQLIHQKGEFLSPFIVENQLQNMEGIVNGTVIKIKEQVILAIQSHLPLKQLEQIFSGIPYDQIRKITQIPLDPRHHTKIDYALLSKILISHP